MSEEELRDALASLIEKGLVEHDPVTDRYRLTEEGYRVGTALRLEQLN